MIELYSYFIRLAKAEVNRRRMSISYTPERRKDLKNATKTAMVYFKALAITGVGHQIIVVVYIPKPAK